LDALVTDAHISSALAGVRALGAAGIATTTLGPGRGAAALWSRHAAARAVGPDSEREPAGFVERVSRIAEECGPLVVYPGRESAIDALLGQDGGLGRGVVLPFPDASSVDALRDKSALAVLARAAGLSTPGRAVAAQAAELARASPRGPWVVKPTRPGGALASAYLGTSADELRAVVRPLPRTEPLLLQERARGRQLSIALVLDREGRVTARFQHVVRRTWPLEGGATTLAVGVAPDEKLVEGIARMLREAGYWGFAQIDVVESPTGPMPIDANPRFYTSLPLATASGVNLPAAWHAAVVGSPAPGLSAYRTGVTYRWLEADLSTLARSSPRAALRPAHRPRAGAIWASEDPVPSALLAAGTTGRRGLAIGRRLIGRLPGWPSVRPDAQRAHGSR